MARTISTFLMFDGMAEEAMTFYVALFERSAVTHVERYGAGEGGKEGTLKRAHFTLGGHELMAFDSPVKHAFTFTPAMSLFAECESAAEQERAFEALSRGGQVLMPLDAYGFSTRFAWVNDRFGVSWQLNLA